MSAAAILGLFRDAINPDIRLADTAAERIAVNLTTIDLLALTQCDLIKIDAEGMEEAVLKGAESTVSRLRPVIYAENNSRDRSAGVLRWLLEREYAVYFHNPQAYNPENHYCNEFNAFGTARERNIIAIPRERNHKNLHLDEAVAETAYPE